MIKPTYITDVKVPVIASPSLMINGWYGGKWMRFIGNRTVDYATKDNFAGFVLFGYKLRDEGIIPYQYENIHLDAKPAITIMVGGYFEFNNKAYDPLQVYNPNDKLYVDDNAVLTNVDTGFSSVGVVSATPQTNNNWLGAVLF